MSLSDTGFPNTCCRADALEISLTSQHVQVSSVETMRYAICIYPTQNDRYPNAGRLANYCVYIACRAVTTQHDDVTQWRAAARVTVKSTPLVAESTADQPNIGGAHSPCLAVAVFAPREPVNNHAWRPGVARPRPAAAAAAAARRRSARRDPKCRRINHIRCQGVVTQ